MSIIDVEQLLQQISDEAPSGEDLEYDPAYGEMARAAEGRAAQQMGDSVVEAEEPDWRSVRNMATELLARSKDLRIGVQLTRALLNTDGVVGLSDGLEVTRRMLDQFWDNLHPQLDPDDDNDPIMRINTLVSLTDRDTMLADVRKAPLVSSRGLGRFSLRDIEIATGAVQAPEGAENLPSIEGIDAAFMDADLDELKVTADAIGAAIENVEAIESFVTEKVGVGQAADLSALPSLLRTAQQVMVDRLSRRGVGVETSGEEGAEAAPSAEGAPQPIAGEIRSREDVVRVLDKACEYFERHEPSSPIPLLLRRAKRLVSKDFMEILRDLAPDGVEQAENIGGTSNES
jgi:type VI secretion system protein ImpA